jgi:hypothetical protein
MPLTKNWWISSLTTKCLTKESFISSFEICSYFLSTIFFNGWTNNQHLLGSILANGSPHIFIPKKTIGIIPLRMPNIQIFCGQRAAENQQSNWHCIALWMRDLHCWVLKKCPRYWDLKTMFFGVWAK